MKTARIFYFIIFASIIGMFFGSYTGLNPMWAFTPVATFGALIELKIIQLPHNILATNFAGITSVTMVDLDGRESMGGYTNDAFLYLDSDVSAYPDYPNKETVTDVKDLVRLTGGFTMKNGKYMYRVKVKPQTTNFDAAGQGEPSGKSFKPKVQFFIPGIDPSSAGLARYLNNKMGGLIIPDPDGTHRICIGLKDLLCEFKPSAKSGSKAADAKGFTFDAECDSFAPAWFYEGPIPLSGSTLSGIS